jgi:hypothetical protein
LKRLITICILFTFIFNNFGYYIIFKTLQFKIRREIADKIKTTTQNDKFHVITVTNFTKSQLNWSLFEDNEFEYKGVMYDVVRVTEKAKSFSYYCITDTEESMLSNKLDKLIQAQLSHSKKTTDNHKSSDKHYNIAITASLSNLTKLSTDTFRSPFLNCSVLMLPLDISVPPPKLA